MSMLTSANYRSLAVAIDALLVALSLHREAVEAVVSAEDELRWALLHSGSLDQETKLAAVYAHLRRLSEARRAHRAAKNDYHHTLTFVFL